MLRRTSTLHSPIPVKTEDIFIVSGIISDIKRDLNHHQSQPHFDRIDSRGIYEIHGDIVIASWITTPIPVQLSRTASYYR